MDQTKTERVAAANRRIVERINTAAVSLIDVRTASEAIPEFGNKMILHAGPPIDPSAMCGAMRNAVYGACVYEGWAVDIESAEGVFNSGKITVGSAHQYSALGPMAGIISPSMPVLVLENDIFKNRCYVTINEGLGKTLRFGANDPSVIARLKWIEKTLAPMLKATLSIGGPVDVTGIMTRAVQRGDECHNRNKAATSLLIRRLAPWMVRTRFAKSAIAEALSFVDSNDHFFLNISMAAIKAVMDKAHEIPGGSIVSCMAANGTEFGIKIAGSDCWYKAESVFAEGNYFPGFSREDANPVMGDSYIAETAGLGGIALALAPGIVAFIGGTVEESVSSTLEMYRITAAEHALYKIPFLGFRGTPLGIDVRKVLDTGIYPLINTGIAHKEPGTGQIGAGRFRAPRICFEQAASALNIL